jgi:outer membrane protein assembly factor BamE (lipoprotein component of BamABCDE complex)
MRAIMFLSVVIASQIACTAPVLYHQNLGPSHKVRRGMTADQVRVILGDPFASVVLDGVEEWRYCDSRSYTDEFVVVYFQKAAVVDKASYTILNPSPNRADERMDDCRASQDELYKDRRAPPRRVQDLRRAPLR